MSIANNLLQIKSQIPENVTLVAVSKTKSIVDIMEAYNAGQRIFGENKIQEMTEKWEQMPKDIQWHMIGHVQTNKIKYMIPYVNLIHGVDSLKLIKEINRLAVKWRKHIDCLLQIYIASEETKFGLNEQELEEILYYVQNDSMLTNVTITGFMGMASFTNDETQIKKEFLYLKSLFDKYKPIETSTVKLQTLSMGMSNDYKIALECGSTMVRIGSTIFGTR